MNAPASFAAQGARRTGEKVRRDSLDVDDPRAQVFRPVDGGHKFVDAVLRAFDEWADIIKKAGKPHHLNANCKKVLEVLLRRCTDFKTGTCEPCLDTLQRMTRFARPTVVRCLRILREAKFVNWLRRTVRTENAPGEGPQVRQVSNAYWIELAEMPKRVAMDVRARLRKAGVKVQERREPRLSVFAGRWRSRREEARRSRAERWTSAGPAERAALMHPGDLEKQQEYLALLAESASSPCGLNPRTASKDKRTGDA